MKLSLCSLLLSAASNLVLALPINDTFVYDAVIVGGGPAGLSIASALGRVRRNALVIDSGEYRNAPTRHMHDVLGFDGVTPAWYRYSARKQIAAYNTITFTNGTVTKIDGNDQQNFAVTSTGFDNSTFTVRARKVVLATGLKDDLPETPGIWENWGKGMYWCPWCDGHEHADQPLGLLVAQFSDIPSSAREVMTLNPDLIGFANGTDTPDGRAKTEAKNPKFQTYMDLHKVRVDNRTIARIVRLKDGGDPAHDPSLSTAPEYDLFSVEFTEGEPVQRAGFLLSYPEEQRSRIGPEAGVQIWGSKLAVDQSKGYLTNVPGIYAIGDANSDNSTNVPHALYTGKRAAVFMHVRLAKEDQAKETGVDVSQLLKRDVELETRSLWDQVNGQPGEILYAGEYDQ
ncbi:sulphydryl oxidase [Pyricularia oryzae 70-15]|uniref:Sulphydryl oxidase n=3 Tax=Pyricularia oryzae TaxID=318829 RepID=G4N8T5_PYRO7|nr:sulphydryl oxidase [Pyricularia oryzae 70-15]EHA51081.1 sulphydryl oxidase [Pyricularia oryzae 70-15]ELQ33420.1 sulphydryl oxidase [Pyricularia oryzae Y34]KAI7914556.1 sulphydryl oxidase [Pyricularia oryzae]KAI7917305.1 sulphydryl oxidase [Pyricularia oryzae]